MNRPLGFASRRLSAQDVERTDDMGKPLDTSTARLSAEPLTRGHFDDVHALHTDPVFMKYLGGPRSEAETREYLDRNIAHWDCHGFGISILRLAETGEFAGRAGLRFLDLDGKPEVELGWGLRPAFWGRGLATEFANECLHIADHDLRRQTVVATTLRENEESKRVMARIGMTFEREVRLNGVVLDLYRVGLGLPFKQELPRPSAAVS